MCGGEYTQWKKPRQLTEINGEPIIARTIRLLVECGVDYCDIAISTNHKEDFKFLSTYIIDQPNNYLAKGEGNTNGLWLSGFPKLHEPVCYIFGDVVFSKEAIKTIVDTETTEIEFFASAPPFDARYAKKWAEPFAIKVGNVERFENCVFATQQLASMNAFKRPPIMWELWQVIKGTPLNIIDYTNYTVINDWTCDIDSPEDVAKIARYVSD